MKVEEADSVNYRGVIVLFKWRGNFLAQCEEEIVPG